MLFPNRWCPSVVTEWEMMLRYIDWVGVQWMDIHYCPQPEFLDWSTTNLSLLWGYQITWTSIIGSVQYTAMFSLLLLTSLLCTDNFWDSPSFPYDQNRFTRHLCLAVLDTLASMGKPHFGHDKIAGRWRWLDVLRCSQAHYLWSVPSEHRHYLGEGHSRRVLKMRPRHLRYCSIRLA